MTEPVVVVASVTHGERSPGVAILSDVSLTAMAGQVVVIEGRSGSGKSTLCQLVAGLEAPDRGEVTVGGDRASSVRDWARLALLPQRLGLPAELTVAENVTLPCWMRGLPGRPDLLEAFDLVHLADRRTGERVTRGAAAGGDRAGGRATTRGHRARRADLAPGRGARRRRGPPAARARAGGQRGAGGHARPAAGVRGRPGRAPTRGTTAPRLNGLSRCGPARGSSGAIRRATPGPAHVGRFLSTAQRVDVAAVGGQPARPPRGRARRRRDRAPPTSTCSAASASRSRAVFVGANLTGVARVEQRDQHVGEHVAGEQHASVGEQPGEVADRVGPVLEQRAGQRPAIHRQGREHRDQLEGYARGALGGHRLRPPRACVAMRTLSGVA